MLIHVTFIINHIVGVCKLRGALSKADPHRAWILRTDKLRVAIHQRVDCVLNGTAHHNSYVMFGVQETEELHFCPFLFTFAHFFPSEV